MHHVVSDIPRYLKITAAIVGIATGSITIFTTVDRVVVEHLSQIFTTKAEFKDSVNGINNKLDKIIENSNKHK